MRGRPCHRQPCLPVGQRGEPQNSVPEEPIPDPVSPGLELLQSEMTPVGWGTPESGEERGKTECLGWGRKDLLCPVGGGLEEILKSLSFVFGLRRMGAV